MAPTGHTATELSDLGAGTGIATGVLPSQRLREAVTSGMITAGDWRVPLESIQPASVDLRLGEFAWSLRCSFLPDSGSTVEEKIEDLKIDTIDLRDGATLERDRPYLVPLIEELRLPQEIRARTNPKSSTGRLDVFTRVITDRNHRFDEIGAGYHGKLYLEVVPRSFAIRVQKGLSLNQVRLIDGEARLTDRDLATVHEEFPLLYMDSHALRASELSLSDGLFLSLNIQGTPDSTVGYRAKRNSLPVDLASVGTLKWQDYWEPVHPEHGGRIVLEPEAFYLLLSAEGVSIPPSYAAEMLAYDPTAGELRTHYAGFFDPGFGYSQGKRKHGSRAALEVRARDVPFMVEHRQPVCKLAFERMAADPDVLYGQDIGSNYQGQETMLSKHFADQTAGNGQLAIRGNSEPLESMAPRRD
ncbi:MAG TPA: 2'-deoxycytidine 5'-triphosphate deaminase [Solirubrobacteraceae bacterium]|jgi:dCTP deaminase|nr:2'-deoxycytidine 5'-triphosphate deaminase [Solirubrobacteraceae bacterium]